MFVYGRGVDQNADLWTYLIIAPNEDENVIYVGLDGTAANWTHVVMTFDGNQRIVYVNGVKKQATDVCCNHEIVTQPTPVTIGQAGVGYSRYYYYGLVDELRIYNHTLSELHVSDLYENPCT